MYNFIDTTETPEGLSLPSEALMLNGEYIENLITGYRTLTVEGREALSPEISAFDTGIRDGSTMQGKRYPARTIRITYQLIAESAEAFREAYNKLGSILNVTDAQLIFNDEQDKFYTGTPSYIGEVEPGKNAVVGEFEITCLDPFKYSVTEYEVVPGVGETDIVIDYNGTYKGFPTLRAEFFNEDEASEDGETVTALSGKGDCGYVAFFNEEEKIIQIGDPDEVDTESGGAKSQTLVNQKLDKSTSWGKAAQSLWSANNGKVLDGAGQVGNTGIAAATYILIDNSSKFLRTDNMLKVTSSAEQPYINYSLAARAGDRTKTSVRIHVWVTSSLEKDSNYFGKGYVLKGTITVGDQAKTVILKGENTRWEGKEEHIAMASFDVPVSTTKTSITGVYFQAFRDDDGGNTGVLAMTKCKDIKLPVWTDPVPETYYLKCTNYGTGNEWHGSSITKVLPADAIGDVGANNFRLSFTPIMSIGLKPVDTNQIGALQALVLSGSGADRKVLAGVKVLKVSNGTKANVVFYINGITRGTVSIDLSYYNKNFNGTKASSITKSGNTVTFDIGGIKKVYTVNAIADIAATEVTFAFLKYGNKPDLYRNGINSVTFIKDNCTTWRDIPNKFSANDVVEADCKTGEISLNGVASPALGALGNDWEGFCLTPGINQIGFSYSEWVESQYAPTFRVRYREVFL